MACLCEPPKTCAVFRYRPDVCLAANGPATSVELPTRTGINERYAREWLGGMASAGYLAYDPTSQRFTLPAEHALPLAQEGDPVFFGGVYHWCSDSEFG